MREYVGDRTEVGDGRFDCSSDTRFVREGEGLVDKGQDNLEIRFRQGLRQGLEDMASNAR